MLSLPKYLVAIAASPFVRYVQKGWVRYQLVKLAVIDDQLLQAFIVLAMDISCLSTKMLTIANASNLLIVFRTPIPAIHHYGHPN